MADDPNNDPSEGSKSSIDSNNETLKAATNGLNTPSTPSTPSTPAENQETLKTANDQVVTPSTTGSEGQATMDSSDLSEILGLAQKALEKAFEAPSDTIGSKAFQKDQRDLEKKISAQSSENKDFVVPNRIIQEFKTLFKSEFNKSPKEAKKTQKLLEDELTKLFKELNNTLTIVPRAGESESSKITSNNETLQIANDQAGSPPTPPTPPTPQTPPTTPADNNSQTLQTANDQVADSQQYQQQLGPFLPPEDLYEKKEKAKESVMKARDAVTDSRDNLDYAKDFSSEKKKDVVKAEEAVKAAEQAVLQKVAQGTSGDALKQSPEAAKLKQAEEDLKVAKKIQKAAEAAQKTAEAALKAAEAAQKAAEKKMKAAEEALKRNQQQQQQSGGGGGGGGGGNGGGGGGGGNPPGRPFFADRNVLVALFAQLKQLLAKVMGETAQFQNTALSFGFDTPINQLNNSLLNNIPAITELKTSTIALQTGLEDNYTVVGEQLARSDLLGEDTAGLATSIQSLRGVLDLSIAGTETFTQSVADSAKTYNTSTTALMKSISQFAESIKATMLGAGGVANIQAFKEIESRVQRLLPAGVLQQAAGPLFSGGLQGYAPAGLLGIEEETRVLAGTEFSGEQKTEALISAFEKAVATGEEYLNRFGDTRTAESALGGALEPFGGLANLANMRMVSQALQGVDVRDPETARIQDAIQSINALGQMLLEPLALISQSWLIFLGLFGSVNKFLAGGAMIIAFSQAIRVLMPLLKIPVELMKTHFTIGNILRVLQGMAVQNAVGKTKSMAGGLLGLLGGWPGIVIGLLSFLPLILTSSEGTKKSVKRIDEKTKDQNKSIESRSQDILNKQASFLAQLSQQTIRSQILISKTDNDDTANILAQQRLQKLGDLVDGVNKLSDKRTKRPDILDQARR